MLLAAPGAPAPDPAPELQPLWGEPTRALVLAEETLLDVAFRYRVGADQLVRLNPDVDEWIPEPGTSVELPTQMILPQARHLGLVINIPEMRLYDFTAPEDPRVYSVAIGDALVPTPTGSYRVGQKRIDPVWNVPESIRAERPELPAQVPPGPDNPLGDRWLTIGTTSYGIHGTNNTWSIGRIATHGCIRLYADTMRELYDRVPKGTRIEIVYQVVKLGRAGDGVFLEAHADPYAYETDLVPSTLVRLLAMGLSDAVDQELVRDAIERMRGVPVQIGTLAPAQSSSTSRRATWRRSS